MRRVIVFLFVFLNYYNPVSVLLTIAFNLAMVVAIYDSKKTIRFDKYIFLCSLVIVVWALIVMAVQLNPNTFVLGKYFRIILSTFSILVISNGLNVTPKELTATLGAVFFLHIFAVALQNLFPQLDLPMANLFGFSREATVITDYSIRKLGLSSSYDTAALISLLAMCFFFYRYVSTTKNVYFLLAFISMISTVRISRTGMVIGILLFIGLCLRHVVVARGKKVFVPLLFLAASFAITVLIVLPIVASSTDSFLAETMFNTMVFENNDYTTGTVEGLMDSHLDPLKAPLFDLFIGYAVDPNAIGKGTDIGYVKLIYHIGVVGLSVVLGVYGYIYRKSLLFKRRFVPKSEGAVLSSFLLLFVVLLLVMNFKSLEVYSRGNHDLMLIIFCVLANNYLKPIVGSGKLAA